MVGGKVIGIARRGDEVLLHVADGQDSCAVRCKERRKDTGESISIAVGDSVWWQSGEVHWNPRGTDYSGKTRRFINGKATYDIPLPKIGYSH